MLLIDIGSGERPYEDGRGWTHVDSREMPYGNVVCKAEHLHSHFGEGTADEIVANHILEHFPYRDTVGVLLSWRHVLRDGGTLHIEVPNLTGQMEMLARGAHGQEHPAENDEEVVRLMYGEQDHAGNYHYAAFTEALLRHRLGQARFRDVSTQDIGMVIVADARK